MRSNSLVNSNILHRVLSKTTNILYNLSNTIFDHVLLNANSNSNYFLRSNEEKIHIASNLSVLNSKYEDLYEYDIFFCNSVTTAIENRNQILGMHINPIISEMKPRPPQIKKEDLVLMNQQLAAIPKIFYDENCMQSWRLQNSNLINIGIPLELLQNSIPLQEREKHILIIGDRRNVLVQQMLMFFKNNNIDCDVMSEFYQYSITEISNLFNQYQVMIDLTLTPMQILSGLACGCRVVSLSTNINFPYVEYGNSFQDIPVVAINALKSTNEYPKKEINQYLDEKFNYDQFRNNISNFIDLQKRKAFFI